jgi:hypothetical protein
MKYVLRIVTLPFYGVLVLVGLMVLLCKHLINWVRYGGEAVAYRKDDKKIIYDLYLELKKQNETSN